MPTVILEITDLTNQGRPLARRIKQIRSKKMQTLVKTVLNNNVKEIYGTRATYGHFLIAFFYLEPRLLKQRTEFSL